ncbi:MAG TPA: ROK family protein [Candidatus Paceibacterota bacterium]
MYILFDIGGTKMRVAASKDGATLSEPKIVETPKDFEQGINTLVAIANECAGNEQIQGVAGGIPGPLDKEKTMVVNAPNLAAWNNKPFMQELQKRLKTPVKLENDAVLAGLGEAVYGAGKNHRIVVFMTISTGIGGARIEDGKVTENILGFEPGHQILNVQDSQTKCGCGGFGHLEAYASGSAVERRYGKKPAKITDQAVWDELAKILAAGVHNTIVHWSPDIVVLGGSMITKEPGISLEKVRQNVQDIMKIFPEVPSIEKVTLRGAEGLYGALALLKNNE